MVLIVGLFAGLGLFYFWLLGHWFARWLVAIALFVPALWIGASLGGGVPGEWNPSAAMFGVVFGVGVSWLVASLPTFFHRRSRHQLIAPNYGAGRDIRRSLP